jgi:hypothetical protein
MSKLFVNGCKAYSLLHSWLFDHDGDLHKSGIESQRFKGLLFDFNIENIGYNKQKGESLSAHASRVWHCDYLYRSHDYALSEFCPSVMMQRNSLLAKTCNKTYYFSYAEGIRNRKKMK